MGVESDCRSTDPYFYRIADDVAVLIKDGAKQELFAFMQFLLLNEQGGIGTPAHSARLDQVLARLASLIDLQAGRVGAWSDLESELRKLDYNLVFEDPESGYKWSEYNALAVMGCLARAGGFIAAGQFIGELNADLGHYLRQATLDVGQYHAVRERATHASQLLAPSSPLYDERLAEQRRLEETQGRMWRRSEEVETEARRRMSIAIRPLAAACSERHRVAAVAVKPRWGFGWLLACCRTGISATGASTARA